MYGFDVFGFDGFWGHCEDGSGAVERSAVMVLVFGDASVT